MKNVYFVDEYMSSMKNGIGSFRGEYFYCLKRMEVAICLIVFNSIYREFTIKEKGGIKTMYFPALRLSNLDSFPIIVCDFFRLYIDDSLDNVFCFNYSPCADLLQRIKKSHPLSKQIYIIHDLGWTLPFLGDLEKLNMMISNRNQGASQGRLKYLLSVFDEEKRMCDIVESIVCLSASTFEVLKTNYLIDEAKIHLIPNGRRGGGNNCIYERKKILRKQAFINDNEKIILFVGRLTKAKGIYALLMSFREILKECSLARLVIAGAMPPDFELSLFNDIAYRVTYTGHIGCRDLNNWYIMADIGVIPSYTEQCSYVGIEMMMHGLPIVASDGFGLRDMFHDGVNAVIATIGNRSNPAEFSYHLSNALLKLLFSAELAREIGDTAKKCYRLYYTISKMQKGYKELLFRI